MSGGLKDLLDQAHASLTLFNPDGISGDVWREKYRWGDEANWNAMAERVAYAICADEPPEFQVKVREAISLGLWIPAGRILSGAGTSKIVTMMNCYVNMPVPDDLKGIHEALTLAAVTQQMGGGIGTAFHTLRPKGAWLRRTHTYASGPIPFMREWDAMCGTIKSAGERRGAMMGTITDWHPDLPDFIMAKKKAGELTNFNISVLVSDAFMEAVRDDEDWLLYFHVPPAVGWRSPDLEQYDFEQDGVRQYVYSIWKARELWKMITENTYEYSEPGVIFIDRVNDINNLHYAEEIMCTNPCGEQPLPPYGTCNLGHINLSRIVRNPFTDRAAIDFDLLKQLVQIGQRFLDDVIDKTLYPDPKMQEEEFNKRRTGLGAMGVADLLAQLQIRYGSPQALAIAEQVQRFICIEAYKTSVRLAEERGSFPLYNAEALTAPSTFISQRLPSDLVNDITTKGLRNGVLLSYAPTGTVTIPIGYPAGGLEPHFAHKSNRKVRQKNQEEWKEYTVETYSSRLWHLLGNKELPAYMVEAEDLTVEEHITMQASIQKWVDASVSKTVNVPKEMEYDDFVKVYDLAYALGCKGCATYRPSDVRGSILTKASTGSPAVQTEIRERTNPLRGWTYKIRWPNRIAALYLVINEDTNGVPFEVFIISKDARDSEWTTALTLMITANLRKGGIVSFISDELTQIQSVYDGNWVEGKYFGSLPAYIGHILSSHLKGEPVAVQTEQISPSTLIEKTTSGLSGMRCPKCSAPALIKEEGCEKCLNCDYSKCE